ncbi:MAG TPA: hypothetical protein VMS12_04085 [Thermoanaerobaculia bacterium]|nr:hypothetical protein [Thermoanaerobaculia bacterium]
MTSISTMLLMIHICGAVVGLLSGFLAMVFRKGSGLHRMAGNFFFVSMLGMSASAAYLAVFVKPNMLNMTVGLLTFYLVATAWRAARRSDHGTGPFDLGALLFVLIVATLGFSFGLEAVNSPTGSKNGMPAPIYFVLGSIAFLCAVADVRMLTRGDLRGGRRIARHLWRMCLALVIATLSLYPGQGQLFPDWLRQTNLLFVPHVLLLGPMMFWRLRVRSPRGIRHETAPHSRPDVAPITEVVGA